ncbi:arylsulfotransferase family protein [Aspergillus homomorphus CBS 101889]|uniref:Arylsulfotransferase n=1 Tax=Aspergillus homomorphus (strain CBS 101889) TaxID=1450537 RepID=A0A395ICI2_ASPHC|nr:hypothetical protein BO97DRAFT_402441 [Aspergillus homomorphus CBS 101889]RAL16818.1 hypothetical protein BO97DRAFT_402441 [Aspergillus homomorphus CBS 101889]
MTPVRLLILVVATVLLASTRADEGPYFQSQLYEQGRMGSWPTEQFRSTTTVGLAVNWVQESARCKDGQYYLLAPRGDSVHRPGPMILDQHGHLVWTKEYGQTYNLNVQRYRGRDYLTFWAGSDADVGHGRGTYYMLDSSYNEAYKISAAGGLSGDLHEFHITRDDTALLTSYDLRRADLSAVEDGPTAGWIWESTFQEVDIATGTLRFEWHASEHIGFEEVERGREGNGGSRETAWDFFHINSVDKDQTGNYLISSRYTSSLTYISGVTGAVLWRLGGRRNDFTDLSPDGGRAATNFTWQHHARFRDNDTAITLFDNGSRGAGAPSLPSRGLYLDLNQANRTVRLRHVYTTPDENLSSQSQGSLQVTASGTVLVGYGWNPAWTEFSVNGVPLCTVHFGPLREFGTGNILSYRVFKHPWRGHPTTRPAFEVYSYRAAASWNGATDVVSWLLEGTDDPSSGDQTALALIPKSGFETPIPVPQGARARYLRVVALNATGHVLGTSKLARWDPLAEEAVVVSGDEEEDGDGLGTLVLESSFSMVLGFGLCVVVLVAGYLFFWRVRGRGALRRGGDWEHGEFLLLRLLDGVEGEDGDDAHADADGEAGLEDVTLLGRRGSGARLGLGRVSGYRGGRG